MLNITFLDVERRNTMSDRALSFLEVPTRSVKPRTKGLTIARDHNIGYNAAVDMVESTL